MEEHPAQENGQQPSKREQRELKKTQKQQEREKFQGGVARKRQTKNILTYAIIILLIGGLGYLVYYLSSNKVQPYTSGSVHWHATVDIEVCGQRQDLPRIAPGEGHRGLPLLHTHDDNTIHIEGQVFKKEDISLGRFMSAVGAPFFNTTIMDMHNGDVCENTGKPGTVKLIINDAPNDQWRDFVPKDGDAIKIIFD